MISRWSASLISSAVLSASVSDARVTFERIWEYWRGQNWAYTVQQTDDDGYVVGANVHYATDTICAGLVKTDSLGDTTWAYLHLSEYSYGGWGRCAASGGYALLGMLADGAAVIRLEAVGDTCWVRRVAGEAVDIVPTADGGFVAAGVFRVDGRSNAGLVRLGPDGAELWTELIAETLQVTPIALTQTFDGGFVVTGECEANSNLWVAKTDNAGQVEWTYCRAGFDPLAVGCGIVQTSDGEYAVTGPFADTTNGVLRAYIARFGPTGGSYGVGISPLLKPKLGVKQ